MDIKSVLDNQLSKEISGRNKMTDQKITEDTRSDRNSDIKKAAKEMEALFAYQLIKVMRETANALSSEKKGLGSDTYMSLFDMEVSKLFAERGMGLRDALVNWMSRIEGQDIMESDKEEK
jgi:Rod binding domain-containing protein